MKNISKILFTLHRAHIIIYRRIVGRNGSGQISTTIFFFRFCGCCCILPVRHFVKIEWICNFRSTWSMYALRYGPCKSSYEKLLRTLWYSLSMEMVRYFERAVKAGQSSILRIVNDFDGNLRIRHVLGLYPTCG